MDGPGVFADLLSSPRSRMEEEHGRTIIDLILSL